MDEAEKIRNTRVAAGLTQVELAARSGVHQPTLSAYESGTRTPRPDTFDRILKAARRRPSIVLAARRDRVKQICARHGLSNVRVFGSSVRGTDTVDSDVDLLATASNEMTMLDLVAASNELEALLGYPVDIVTDGHDNTFDESVLSTAKRL